MIQLQLLIWDLIKKFFSSFSLTAMSKKNITILP